MDSIVYNMPTVMQEEFIIIFSWGVSQNPFCNSNKLLHFFFYFGQVKNAKRNDNMSDKFLLWHFPHKSDAKKSQKVTLLCPVNLKLLYRWMVTVGWWQILYRKKKSPKLLHYLHFIFFLSNLRLFFFALFSKCSFPSQHISPVDFGFFLFSCLF